MANITIQVDDLGNASVQTVNMSSVQITTLMSPSIQIGTLQGVWDAEDDAGKNTFVDTNEVEIKTFFDDQLITLSADASAAVINIESNGGTLTSAEKYFVGIWVDRIVAKGDWGLVKDIAYAGFANDSCKLSKWKTGGLMINNGATLDGQRWSFDGVNDWIGTGMIPSTIGVGLNDAVYGIYVDDLSEIGADQYTLFGAQSAEGRSRLEKTTTGYSSRANCTGVNVTVIAPLSKSLLVAHRNASNVMEFTLNGEMIDGDNDASTGLPTVEFALGAQNNAGAKSAYAKIKASMFFVSLDVGFDQLDFYAGYEDFRTSLHPEILYRLTDPSTHLVSYRTGDAYDIEVTLWEHFRKARKYWNGKAPVLDAHLTLSSETPNAFGNLNRVTDEVGGQTFTANLRIDHLTGIMWHKQTGNSGTWDTQIDEKLAYTQGGYTNWHMASNGELTSAQDSTGQSRLTGVVGQGFNLFWIADTNIVNSAQSHQFYSQTRLFGIDKTTAKFSLACRKHY